LQELVGLGGIEGIQQFLVLSHSLLYRGLYYKGNSKLGGIEKLRIYVLQGQQGTKERITSIGNNMNSPIRTSAIGLLQHLQLLYLPS
jgi:hypothetical protein